MSRIPIQPPEAPPPRVKRRRFGALRTSFLTGLVVIAPIGLTLWLLWTVIGMVDGFVLPFVPRPYQPENVIETVFGIDAPVNIRGVGVVVFLIFTVLIGWMAKGIIGRSILSYAESLVDRMPVVRSIYNGLKQIAETVFSQADTSFDKACLIQYPREGLWAIAFVSTTAKGEIQEKIPAGGQLMSVFLPTTPNPTSGFLLFVPRRDIIELDMGVEDAAKLVISAGLVYPNSKVPPVEPSALPVKEREKLPA